jgi:hypothetical protein
LLTLSVGGFFPLFVLSYSKVFPRPSRVNLSTSNNGNYFNAKAQAHLSLEEALAQAPHIAASRGISLEVLERLILAHVKLPAFSLMEKQRVHVAELNAAIDQMF